MARYLKLTNERIKEKTKKEKRKTTKEKQMMEESRINNLGNVRVTIPMHSPEFCL
jgi:ribosomal protein L9